MLGRLGEGGMGIVYVGEHGIIGKRVAIKVLLPELSSNETLVRRFFNEARAATQIRYPGIVEVFDFGYHEDGSAYLVMELLEGEPLSVRLKRIGKLPSSACIRLLHQIAGALGAAHDVGIVHRDLKPDNVFVILDPDVTGGERAKVLDFGIAKLTGSSTEDGVKTRTGTIVGTPRYMAPEQCRGAREVDHRADLYALGCIAFEMLCGRPPFEQQGIGELFAAHMLAAPPRPTSIEPSVSPALEEIVLRLLAKEPEQRVQSAAELILALDRAAHEALVPMGTQPGSSGVDAVPVATPMLGAPAFPGAPVVSGAPTPRPTTLGTAVAAVDARTGPGARRTRRGWVIGSAGALAGVAAVLALVLGPGGDESPAAMHAEEPAAAQPSQVLREPATGSPSLAQNTPPANRWVEVAPPPEGSRVVLGISAETAAATPDAIGLRPARELLAPSVAYEIQQHEVTWGELDPWLTDHPEQVIHQPEWLPEEPEKRKDLAATGIPWEVAYAYCQSQGGRLPSEAEWEYAARGPERRAYTWGEARLDTFRTHAYAGDGARMVPVMSRDQDRTPGRAHDAIHDLMGNAREWVVDLWRNDVPGEDESWVQAGGATFRVVRGLPLDQPLPDRLPIEGAAYRDALCAARSCLEGSESVLAYQGFRCARDVAQ